MQVQAAPGTRCPKEGKPREYINDNTPEDVPDSAYYLRLKADGSLVENKEAAPAVIPAKAGIQNKENEKGGKK
jgi:hypothetical protein